MDRFSQQEPRYQEQPESGSGFVTRPQQDTCQSIVPSETIITADTRHKSLTLNPIMGLPAEERTHEANQPSKEPAHSYPHPVELPALKTLDLTPSMEQGPDVMSQADIKDARMVGFVYDAATSMINALSNIMKGTPRRRGQQSDPQDDLEEQRSTELPEWKREMLEMILWAALEKLTAANSPPANPDSSPDAEPEKKDWVQCEYCPKKTRLPCQMKYFPPFFRYQLSFANTKSQLQKTPRAPRTAVRLHISKMRQNLRQQGRLEATRERSPFPPGMLALRFTGRDAWGSALRSALPVAAPLCRAPGESA